MRKLTRHLVWFLVLLGAAASSAQADIRGKVGVGTWNTQAEFSEIKVIQGEKTLYQSDFAAGLAPWATTGGNWAVQNGALRQSGNAQPALAMIGEDTWSNYTLTLKARKISGAEGFLIAFGAAAADANAKSWWNIGGWGNTQHALEAPGLVSKQVPGTIVAGRWYEIKVEVSGERVRAFLDNQLVHEAAQTPVQRNFGRPLVPDLIADPSIAEFDGTFYLYSTTDGAGAGLATSGLPVVWKSQDFLNWSFAGSLFAPNFDAKYWAPSAPVRKDGKFYLFATLDNRITALVSDSPAGPFRTLDGKDIHKNSGWKPFPITVAKAIDAEVLVDDDGAAYMVWAQRGIAKLKADFSGFEGAQTVVPTKRGGYSEGPWLFKRNGVYYYLYTLEGHENYKYAYMMSRTSPLGPWEAPAQDIIAATDFAQGVYGPGHGCFFNPQGAAQWYFVYLEYGRSGTNRQVWADKLNFNADGTIQPVQLTLNGVGVLRANSEKLPNLALGKTAIASSTLPDYRVPPIADARLNRVESYAAQGALDGSNGSRWMAREGDANAWFQLDLGELRQIKSTELYFVKPTAGHAYRLEYSTDGTNWQPYGGHDEVRVQSPHRDAKAVRARFLKVTILQGTPGLWEFRVY